MFHQLNFVSIKLRLVSNQLNVFPWVDFFSKKWKFGFKIWSMFPTTRNMFHKNIGLFHQMEVQFIKLESMDFTFWKFFSSNSSFFPLNCVLLQQNGSYCIKLSSMSTYFSSTSPNRHLFPHIVNYFFNYVSNYLCFLSPTLGFLKI